MPTVEPYRPGAYLWPPSAPSTHTTSAWGPWRWLESTRELQEGFYGVDYGEMDGEELARYLTFNIAAIASELGEFSQEVGWKPWASPRGWVNREEAVGELVDVAHFVANLLCALGVTDSEWESRYRAKQQVNRDRMTSGSYDARSTKCECGRAFEDLQPDEEVPDGRRCVCGRFNRDPA